MSDSWIDYERTVDALDLSPNDRLLMRWPEMAERGFFPEELGCLLPENVGFRLLLPTIPAEELALHQPFARLLAQTGKRICGTLDATRNPFYRSLHRQRGWRTVIYILLRFHHEALPIPEAEQAAEGDR